jgi:hypothetical protein
MRGGYRSVASPIRAIQPVLVGEQCLEQQQVCEAGSAGAEERREGSGSPSDLKGNEEWVYSNVLPGQMARLKTTSRVKIVDSALGQVGKLLKIDVPKKIDGLERQG